MPPTKKQPIKRKKPIKSGTKQPIKSGTRKQNAGNAAKARTTGFRVECSSYPSGNGCYAGKDLSDDYIDSCTNTKVVGSYDTMAQAEQAAIKARNSNCEFDDWAEAFYRGKGPPFFSCDGNNYDDDETMHIYIVDVASEVAGRRKAMEDARSSKPPVQKRAETRTFGPTNVTFSKLEDMKIFMRNPSRIPSEYEKRLPSQYGNGGTGKSSFVYLMQRLSDRNFAMRSLCIDNSGARFTSFELPRIITHCIHWIPDSNLNDHANDDTILDTFHTDLYHHKTGHHCLTAETLLACTKPNMECLFLTNFSKGSHDENSKAIVQAIQTCSANLKCITLNACTMSLDILEALAKCPQLRGLLFAFNETGTYYGDDSSTKYDAAMAKILKSCPQLRWLYMDYFPFHGACWDALDDGAVCPELQVLWIACPVSKDGRMHVTAGNHDTIRNVLRNRALPLLMINPDTELQSSLIFSADKEKSKNMILMHDSMNGIKQPKGVSYCFP
jgi:hypothetical protein